MLFLSAAPFEYKTPKAMHLFHPRSLEYPEGQNAMVSIKSGSKQIVRVGEHMVSDPVFNSFPTVCLHDYDSKIEEDYLRRLSSYASRFIQVARDPNRVLIVYGKAITLLPIERIHVPRKQGLSLKEYGTDGKAITGKGLGVLNFHVDVDFAPDAMNTRYGQVIQLLSQKFPIYLFDSKVLYTIATGGKHNTYFGNLYVADKGRVTKIKEIPDVLSQEATAHLQERKIPNIKAIYEPETDEEKQIINDTAAQHANKEVK